MVTAMNVRELHDPAQQADCQAAWEALLDQTPGATFFHTPQWLAAYWRHCGQQQQWRVLLIDGSDGPLGIVPLVVRTERTRVGPVRVLTYPLHDWGSFYSPIGSDLSVSLQAALEHVHSLPRDWDLLDLRWVATGELDRTAQAMRAAGFQARQEPWIQTLIVDLSQSDWHTYWAGRTSRWRNNVRRSERKLAEAGEVKHIRYRAEPGQRGTIDPRWDLYDACVDLAGRSWQSTASDGTTLSHGSVRDFLREAHAAAAQRAAVDINLLYLSGRPVAFAYNYTWRGWVYGLRMGYDAALARDGAGSVLMHRMLQDSFQRGDQTFDLGAGYFDAKRPWHTTQRYSYRSTHFALSAPRAQLLRAKRWLLQCLGDSPAASESKLPDDGVTVR
jgi:CelD/BcsL family acetyltransferase involved in cellulose biosynthesis